MIIRDPSLFPVSCDPPAAYPPARVKEINRPCTINDIADWVVDYINSDIIVSIHPSTLLVTMTEYSTIVGFGLL